MLSEEAPTRFQNVVFQNVNNNSKPDWVKQHEKKQVEREIDELNEKREKEREKLNNQIQSLKRKAISISYKKGIINGVIMDEDGSNNNNIQNKLKKKKKKYEKHWDDSSSSDEDDDRAVLILNSDGGGGGDAGHWHDDLLVIHHDLHKYISIEGYEHDRDRNMRW